MRRPTGQVSDTYRRGIMPQPVCWTDRLTLRPLLSIIARAGPTGTDYWRRVNYLRASLLYSALSGTRVEVRPTSHELLRARNRRSLPTVRSIWRRKGEYGPTRAVAEVSGVTTDALLTSSLLVDTFDELTRR